jgi:hypothetical protein
MRTAAIAAALAVRVDLYSFHMRCRTRATRSAASPPARQGVPPYPEAVAVAGHCGFGHVTTPWGASGGGWQPSAVRAPSSTTPGNTGWAVWGRWVRHEHLLDPDDVSAGNIVPFVPQQQEHVVGSLTPVHPQITTVAQFTRVQLLMRAKAGAGPSEAARSERTPSPAAAPPYSLRGLVRCGLCGRRMEPARSASTIRYRCAAKSLVPGSPAAASHPRTAHLREDRLLDGLNGWLAGLFAPERRARTFDLVDAPSNPRQDASRDLAERVLADATERLLRLAAIEVGVDPAALVTNLNRPQADRAAMEHSLAQADGDPRPRRGRAHRARTCLPSHRSQSRIEARTMPPR